VLRDATIGNEPLQRGKSLLHPEQVRLRTQRLDAIQSEQRRIEDAKKQKESDRVDNIIRIRSELLKIAGNDDLNHNNSLDECDLAHFKELKADDLVLFILAHDPSISTKAKASKLKKGDKPDEINAAYEALMNDTPVDVFNTKVLAAYRCRNAPCKIDLSNVSATPSPVATTNAVTPSPVAEMTLRVEGDGNVPPSLLLSCDHWKSYVCELFDVQRTVSNPFENINDDAKAKADLLAKILRVRLYQLMNKRNVDGSS
jgi:hypothetical protein